jgi:hypothetical protein
MVRLVGGGGEVGGKLILYDTLYLVTYMMMREMMMMIMIPRIQNTLTTVG